MLKLTLFFFVSITGSFNMLAGANAEINFNKISAGAKIQVIIIF